jgi:hypothetical protein
MAYTDREDLNYLGQLYQIGANQTPFLNMIGGLQQGAKTTNSFMFPVAQPWALNGASQNVKSEAVAAQAGTPTTYTRGQDSNTVQIMKYDYGVSFAKQSTFGELAGLSLAGTPVVRDELSFQKAAALKQMAIDVEFSFLQGAYVDPVTAATEGKTRGMKNAIATNTVAAAAAVSKTQLQKLLREMATNGAQFADMVLLCNAYQKQALTDQFAYAPEDRNVGGQNIKQIETDFAMLGVVWAPFMPTDEIYICDMSVISPVFCPYNGQIISDIMVPELAALKGGFIYSQVGLDYGPEEYHGSITGLKDSGSR